MRAFLTCAFLVGCADSSEDASADSADTAVATVEVSAADRAFELLAGDFDSEQQSKQDPSYFAISLRACEVSFPEMGERVLYVEQAAMDSLTQPYRQRLYVVEDIEDGRVSSEIYAFTDAKASKLIGSCDAPGEVGIKTKHLVLREGCTVWLTEQENGDFVGATEGTTCSSTLGGAAYATSEVSLESARLLSWDQGWDSQGNQVWGAVDGPYRFLRQSGDTSSERR